MRQTPTGTDYAVASESVAIDALDSQFKLARDVAAGEAIFISLKVTTIAFSFSVEKLRQFIKSYSVQLSYPTTEINGIAPIIAAQSTESLTEYCAIL